MLHFPATTEDPQDPRPAYPVELIQLCDAINEVLTEWQVEYTVTPRMIPLSNFEVYRAEQIISPLYGEKLSLVIQPGRTYDNRGFIKEHWTAIFIMKDYYNAQVSRVINGKFAPRKKMEINFRTNIQYHVIEF